mgnify:FL=1
MPDSLSAAKIEDSYMDQVWLTENKGKAKKVAKKPAAKKRARTASGHFVADDPATPENEAYVED